MDRSRSDLEAELAHALSRHIGYTAGAYYIDRIAGITSLFKHKPSLYQFELTQHLMGQPKRGKFQIDEPYAAQILNFAVGLRLVYRVTHGTLGSRLSRIALTPMGATIRSALARKEYDVAKFVLVGLVLESDCDLYGLILDVLHERPLAGAALHQTFRERFEILRRGRVEWLNTAFPNQTLRDRIAAQTTWIPPKLGRARRGGRHEPISKDFARHHVTPRLGWAEWFGHIEPSPTSSSTDAHTLTQSGVGLLRALRGSSPSFLWLGPPVGAQEALGIAKSNKRNGPWAPSWNLLRPPNAQTSDNHVRTIADQVAGFMDTHYDDLKLVHANQASMASILPYLHFIERQEGYSVREDLVLKRIFGKGSLFNVLSTRSSPYGYYQLRVR